MREGNNFSTPNTHVFFNGLGTIYHGEGEGRGGGGGGGVGGGGGGIQTLLAVSQHKIYLVPP